MYPLPLIIWRQNYTDSRATDYRLGILDQRVRTEHIRHHIA